MQELDYHVPVTNLLCEPSGEHPESQSASELPQTFKELMSTVEYSVQLNKTTETGAFPGSGSLPGSGGLLVTGALPGSGILPVTGAVPGPGALLVTGALPVTGILPGPRVLPGPGSETFMFTLCFSSGISELLCQKSLITVTGFWPHTRFSMALLYWKSFFFFCLATN